MLIFFFPLERLLGGPVFRNHPIIPRSGLEATRKPGFLAVFVFAVQGLGGLDQIGRDLGLGGLGGGLGRPTLAVVDELAVGLLHDAVQFGTLGVVIQAERALAGRSHLGQAIHRLRADTGGECRHGDTGQEGGRTAHGTLGGGSFFGRVLFVLHGIVFGLVVGMSPGCACRIADSPRNANRKPICFVVAPLHI